MKKYASHKSYEVIKTQCEQAGFKLDDSQFNTGSDYIWFEFQHERTTIGVCYSTFNGQAFGFANKGTENEVWVSTSTDRHDDCPWFIALLDFIYLPLEEPQPAALAS